MKKIILIIAGVLSTITINSYACTNFLVTKGASKDGSTFISYSADSHTLYGELYFWAAAKHKPGVVRQIREWDSGKFLGAIPEAAETYNVIGNMNEHSVMIGETTYGGREELADSAGLLDYGSLIYIALQRAKNAREAIKTIVELVAQYGYHSEGESFSIGDPNEVWILEMTGKGAGNKGAVWVAVRIPDGYISGHANQARITTFPKDNGRTSISSRNLNRIFQPDIEVVYAEDVISVAREKGYFNGSDDEFSFSDTYNPVTFSGARACEARVWSFFKDYNKEMLAYEDYALGHNLKHRMPLYVKPDRKLDMHDVARAMRDHYEGTAMDMTADIGAGPFKTPYRWRPMTWKYNGVSYVHERATATQQTGWWYVAQARSWLPDAIGGVLWFGVDDAATSVLTPIYCSANRVPEAYAAGNGDLLTYSETAAFWTFTRVAQFAYSRYSDIAPEIVKLQQELERQFAGQVKETDEKALALYTKKNTKGVIKLLTDFSVNTAGNLVKRWKELDAYLLVKYMDGNIKQQTPDGEFARNPDGLPAFPQQPPYPKEWYKAIVLDAGDVLMGN
ncbi:MAG: C69 family dipeptidase [Prevotellaceae bacterium]|jgi:dipeptidase|nr:C69 family dipeptidase [Prevotellaceae bacterium]